VPEVLLNVMLLPAAIVTCDGSNALLVRRQTVPLPGVHVAPGVPGLLGGAGDVLYPPPDPPQPDAAMITTAIAAEEMMFMSMQQIGECS
jgi:hypothetical protein